MPETTQATQRIVVDREGAIAWIRINRPERLNAFVGDMRDRLDVALEWLEQDSEIRCIVITGAGRAFSTGGDVAFMQELIDKGDAESFEGLVRIGAAIVRRIDSMTKPVIAAINGPAAGAGACLALACDIRIASETASLGFTFTRVGLHPDWGGTYFLTKLAGLAVATEAVFTGGLMNAERCERLGLFNRVVPGDQLENTARSMAGQIASQPAGVIADAKRTLRASLHRSLPDILDMEVDAQLRAFHSPDFREGITAFIEKRAPRFNRENGHHG
ncbi:MAG: 2-(1,2-epoxy-1,2-dihydrophenyl)acetyl-CoA isomerase [Candidatus Cloacimonetes bacterium]|nr:2-(1,2-epoxy-1,2-dihydrophenyl)acetyl-CoA isomerase [Candidatus Cloacimonadota bacterium]